MWEVHCNCTHAERESGMRGSALRKVTRDKAVNEDDATSRLFIFFFCADLTAVRARVTVTRRGNGGTGATTVNRVAEAIVQCGSESVPTVLVASTMLWSSCPRTERERGGDLGCGRTSPRPQPTAPNRTSPAHRTERRVSSGEAHRSARRPSSRRTPHRYRCSSDVGPSHVAAPQRRIQPKAEMLTVCGRSTTQ
jgi:hypothetical protein